MSEEQIFGADTATVQSEFASFVKALEPERESLLALDHVVGTAVGHKITGGVATDKPAVMVLVSEKVPESALGDSAVPKRVGNKATDVLEVGHLFAGGTALPMREGVDAQTLAKRTRPVRPGYSIGHPKVTAGTIGAGCYQASPLPGMPPRYFILSNNHVLANSNDASLGDPVLQPGIFDGGSLPDDAIGRLSAYVPITFDGTCNYVDAAIAEVPFDTIDRDIYWIGYPSSLGVQPTVGMLVRKSGRTTHFTTGQVQAVAATVNVNYGGGRVARFCDQIITTAMSAGGDSGSLVLDTTNNPVGLLFAGSSVATILNPIRRVQAALNVRLWP